MIIIAAWWLRKQQMTTLATPQDMRGHQIDMEGNFGRSSNGGERLNVANVIGLPCTPL